jgi:hypothetical protein
MKHKEILNEIYNLVELVELLWIICTQQKTSSVRWQWQIIKFSTMNVVCCPVKIFSLEDKNYNQNV